MKNGEYFCSRNCAAVAAGTVNRQNRAPNLVRVPCATGKDLYRFVTIATNTSFKTGFQTKVLNHS